MDGMLKHAYLIMAHDDLYCLQTLLQTLDHPQNDIFLHIDKKSHLCPDDMQSILSVSNLYCVERTDVRWGGNSQICCEILLLKAAIPLHYDYYHLLSGHDLPIKSMDYILHFFESNKGKEFVSFYRSTINPSNYPRLSLYNFRFKFDFLTKISKKIQCHIGIDRMKRSGLVYQKGGNWFSITHELASYIVSKEKEIKRNFNYCICADEVFLQTLVFNSRFVNNITSDFNDIEYRVLRTEQISGNLRCQDWPDSANTAHPRTFVVNDYFALLNNPNLFARKFDSRYNKNIIDKIAAINI